LGPENFYRNLPVVLKNQTTGGHVNLGKFFLHPIRGGNRRKLTNDGEGSW